MMVGDVAHICNRGVDRRKIFNSSDDYIRFRDNLFLLNNRDGKLRTKHKNIFKAKFEQQKLVEVFKWSLLPNHFHLLVYEVVDGGILEFAKRIGNAYTKYFNIKNANRSGYLFQNSSKIIQIKDEGYMPYLPIYIDLNPSELTTGTVNTKIEFLKKYQWSSFKEYFGEGRDSMLVNSKLFYEIFETTPAGYEEDLMWFINRKEELFLELSSIKGVNLPG